MMHTTKTYLRLLSALVFFAVTTFSVAGPGHDHGPETPTSAGAPAAPRFAAASELFEVVGILNPKILAIYVDRFDTNEPVTKASVELEFNGVKKVGVLNSELGAFEFAADSFAKSGNYALALTITAGDDIDILAGNLVVPEMTEDHTHSLWTLKNAGMAAGAFLLLLILILVIKKSNSRMRTWGTNHA